jgi:Holliday junction DNA helicase RuvA
MAVLSGLSVGEVQEAIVTNRPETLYGITGVGKKTAARIILELRDKILKIQPATSSKSAGAPLAIQLNEDALAALMTLGFPRQTAQKAISGVLESSPGLSVEALVRAALSAIHNNS